MGWVVQARLERIRLEQTGLCWVRLDWGLLGLARLGWNDLEGFGRARPAGLAYVQLRPAVFGCAELGCTELRLGAATLGWARLNLSGLG